MSNEVKENYKEVRIGSKEYDIPSNWEIVRLDRKFNLINGRAFKKSEWSNEGLQIIRIQDLRENNNSETNYCNFEVKDKYYVNKGDLLFCWAGNINTSLGAYIWNREKAVLNQHIYNLKAKEKSYNNYYKNYLNYMLPLLKTLVGGSAGQIHITKRDLKSFKLLAPPLPEQKKIADILSSVDQAIEKTEQIIAKTKELKQGLMQELLTKGIGHDDFKEVRLGVKEYEIPINWDVVQLEDCCEICYGKAQDDVEDKNGRYPILGTGGRIGWANDYLFDEASVLIGRKGTIDEPKFIDEPFWTIDTLFYTEVCDGVIPKWLYYYLDYYDLTLLNEATGVPSLNRKNLYNLDLPFPPYKEQKKIANILSSVDNKIQKKEEKKAKLEELKKGLMQKLLTGEVRV